MTTQEAKKKMEELIAEAVITFQHDTGVLPSKVVFQVIKETTAAQTIVVGYTTTIVI